MSVIFILADSNADPTCGELRSSRDKDWHAPRTISDNGASDSRDTTRQGDRSADEMVVTSVGTWQHSSRLTTIAQVLLEALS